METSPRGFFNPKNFSISSSLSKLCIFFLLTFATVFITFFELQALPVSPHSSSLQQWKAFFSKTYHVNCSKELETMASKLRDSVTFRPLKDIRFSDKAATGNTWFMSSLSDVDEDGEVEHLYFPSEASKGRLLCLDGRHSGDGGKNSYGLAWRDTLPDNASFMEGLTFVSDTYYDYINIYHALMATAPFVGWSARHGCVRPSRWVLYHWGELRTVMGSWVRSLMKSSFGEVNVEGFGRENGGPFCFEKAVVMRHNMGKMGKAKGLETYDLLRCKARTFCNVSLEGSRTPEIRLTLLMRKGARSFKNETAVIKIFSSECARVNECKLTVAHSGNLSFCEQVMLLSATDIVASPHGAQLTNTFLMDKNSSVMEFFPNGWLEGAGMGQYVYHWLAGHSGMIHRGAWWDPEVDKECPHPEKDPQCFLYYKNAQVGHNETYFTEWARHVIDQVKLQKLEQASTLQQQKSNVCAC